MQRAVRFLAAEAGIRQFIDIGTGIPSAGNVHEVAGRAAPGARVVYVDYDPVIHAHANALLTGTGTTRIILADLRDPDVILAGARDFLDFTKPVALLLVAILHFIPDAEDPAGLIAAFRDALPAVILSFRVSRGCDLRRPVVGSVVDRTPAGQSLCFR
jgi:S-adenosyl methyltransferase